jgi:Chaperone of endosialidase
MEAFGPNGDGKLGIGSASRRYKEDIKPMDKASERLFALKPVTFRAKGNMDPGNVKHYGLIAEDVAAVDPDLVVYNPDGQPETLRFESINAMLLNEFLKEHQAFLEEQRKVQEQKATIAQLKSAVAQQQKETEVLTAQLKEQAAQIQKVSAQVKVIKFATG